MTLKAGSGVRHWVARRMRWAADWLDPEGAFRRTHLSFTFEHRVGLVVNDHGQGCPLWYQGRLDYARAHDEATTAKEAL